MQQVLLASQTAEPEHLHCTVPHALVTLVLHEVPHVGSVQQVCVVMSQVLPLPQFVLQVWAEQPVPTVAPHVVPHAASVQHMSVVVSQALFEPHEVALQVVSPQSLCRVVLHWPLQASRLQHVPATAPAAFLQVWLPQPQEMVPPQPSSSVPHWPG